jgi:hypothetical protein
MRLSRPALLVPIFLLLILLGADGGCDSTLETGYQYHKLNSTDADRRSYYAPAFSPESNVPKHAAGGFSSGE